MIARRALTAELQNVGKLLLVPWLSVGMSEYHPDPAKFKKCEGPHQHSGHSVETVDAEVKIA